MRLPASTPLRFAAVVLLCAGVLLARSPALFLFPTFVLEDGKIFFAQAYNRAPADAIFAAYAGYWHLVPRLVAEVGTLLPLGAAPLFFAVCALTISSVAISWFTLPHFRAVVANDWLRLAFVLLLVLLPGLDGPVLVAYVQWYLALWGMLLILMTPPRRRWVQWALALAYVAALATAPVLFVLLPLWVWRFLRAEDRGQQAWIGLIAAATLTIALLTLLGPRGTPAVEPPGDPLDWGLMAVEMARAVAFRVFALPLLGYALAAEIVRALGWPLIFVVAAALAAALMWATLASANRNKRAVCLALWYVAASTSALYVLRAPIYGYPFAATTDGTPFGALRYFFLAIAAVLLIALITVDRWLAGRRIGLGVVAAGVALLLLHYSPNFPLPNWGDAQWPRYARLLGSIVDPGDPGSMGWSAQYPQPPVPAETSSVAEPLGLRIPIAPEGWNMLLTLPAGGAQGYVFPEGPRLLGLESEIASGTGADLLAVTVFWRGPAEGETAYVHLLDGEGNRMAGADVLMAPSPEPSHGDEVWRTRHVLELPLGTGQGRYDVAVGLYRLAEEELIPGSAVIVHDAVEVGGD